MIDGTDELPLVLPAPAVSPEQVGQLVAVLTVGPCWLPEAEQAKARGWMTAAQIATQLPGTSDRLVRKIAAAAAPTVVSYPGSPGYKLWAGCSVAEIGHAIEAFEAQARDMIKRAHLYRMAYHRRFRGAPPQAAANLPAEEASSHA